MEDKKTLGQQVMEMEREIVKLRADKISLTTELSRIKSVLTDMLGKLSL
ncbi:MAG: hypothetical protein JJV88_01400 [Sulfurovum sp.]|nr:hypothetical protein [Sulfurovaceae bacterium]